MFTVKLHTMERGVSGGTSRAHGLSEYTRYPCTGGRNGIAPCVSLLNERIINKQPSGIEIRNPSESASCMGHRHVRLCDVNWQDSKGLQRVVLRQMDIGDLDVLGVLNLTKLTIDRCWEHGIHTFAMLTSMTSLRELDICRTNLGIRGIRFVFPPNISTLALTEACLTTFENFVWPINLLHLDLRDNEICSLETLKLPMSVVTLELQHNGIVSLDGFVPPSALTTLVLHYNALKTFDGAYMRGTRLCNLDLESNDIYSLNMSGLPSTFIELDACDNGLLDFFVDYATLKQFDQIPCISLSQPHTMSATSYKLYELMGIRDADSQVNCEIIRKMEILFAFRNPSRTMTRSAMRKLPLDICRKMMEDNFL